MEFGWSEEQAAFREAVRAFTEDRLPEGWASRVPGDEPYSDLTLSFCRDLAKQGWFAPHWPKEYGGGGDPDPWRFAILGEELWSKGEPRGSQYMNVNWIGPAIIAAGTEEQKARFIGGMAAGEMLWCQGFSEPEAGSDLASMKTFAVRDGDDYVINGVKIWTSYAKKADYCFLLARTDLQTDGGGGVSIFLVPTSTPGFKIEVVPTMLDIHVVHRLTFADMRVPAALRLGEENAGWTIIREALSDERVGTPRNVRAAALLDEVIRKAVSAGEIDDVTLSDAAMAYAACQAARVITYKIRQARGSGGAGAEAYVARGAIVNAERAVANVATTVSGAAGLESGTLADGEFRTALIAGLGGGSYEMQLNLIARLWLNLPKAA